MLGVVVGVDLLDGCVDMCVGRVLWWSHILEWSGIEKSSRVVG